MSSLSNTEKQHKNIPAERVKHTVLVLDDDPLVRWSLRNALEKAGVDVQAVESGEEAIRILGEMRFDAIITDMELPHIDGFAVAAAGRCRERGIPVIMVTASGDESTRMKAAAMGINHFIDKPFDLDEIVCLVKELIPGLV